ncbi:MAG: carboxypeptidase-like regulatory domain-containing protein [Planctomycetota bacterium]
MFVASPFSRITASLAVLSVVLQPALTQAAQESRAAGSPPAVKQPVTKQPAASIADVGLQQGGVLTGQITDAKGASLPGVAVVAASRKGQSRTTTDANGRFAIAGLEGGLHRVEAAGQTTFCRAWAPGTQPPNAQTGLLLVAPSDIALGQHCGSRVGSGYGQGYGRRSHPFRNPVVMGGVVAAAIAIPVALSNSDDDNPLASP